MTLLPTLRRAHRFDSQEIQFLQNECFNTPMQNKYNTSLFFGHNVFPYVLEKIICGKNTIIGFVCLYILEKINRKVAIIEDIMISKNERGKHYPDILIQKCIDVAKHHQCYKIILNCKPELRKYYQNYGFQEEQCQMAIRF